MPWVCHPVRRGCLQQNDQIVFGVTVLERTWVGKPRSRAVERANMDPEHHAYLELNGNGRGKAPRKPSENATSPEVD